MATFMNAKEFRGRRPDEERPLEVATNVIAKEFGGWRSYWERSLEVAQLYLGLQADKIDSRTTQAK